MSNTKELMEAYMGKPLFLYHYTGIHSLAMILKSKSIRFNSLCSMDDLQEQQSSDVQNFGKFVFVSSWTADREEYIPMWRMYTPKGEGIRIKLVCDPFVEYEPDKDTLSKIFSNATVHDESSRDNANSPFKLIVPTEEYFSNVYSVINFSPSKILYSVNYTADVEELNPQVLNIENGKFQMLLSKIGMSKNKYWSFQKEWRYILMIAPLPLLDTIRQSFSKDTDNTAMYNFQQNVLNGTATLPFSSYFLKLRDETLSTMEIMLAPDISESSRLFVELLVKEYCPTVKIVDSILLGKLK